MGVAVESLLAEAADDEERAISCWRQDIGCLATCFSSVGLMLEDCCGSAPWHLHLCSTHGAEVSARDLHGLSYRSSEGWHMRHSALSPWSSGSDGKRPDGMTLVPWRSSLGCHLHRYLCGVLQGPSDHCSRLCGCSCGEKKCEKYFHLVPNYIIQPVVMETSGVIGPNSVLLRAPRSRLAQESGDTNSTA